MRTNKNVWNVVHECDLDDGTPTEWGLKVAEGKFYWIEAAADGTYDVINDNGCTVKTCKSLASAKRWVTSNLL